MHKVSLYVRQKHQDNVSVRILMKRFNQYIYSSFRDIGFIFLFLKTNVPIYFIQLRSEEKILEGSFYFSYIICKIVYC